MQDKSLRIINTLPKGTPINDTHENSKILKLQDYISLQNSLLVEDCFDEQLPKPLLINYFKKTNTHYEHSTRSATKNCVFQILLKIARVSALCNDKFYYIKKQHLQLVFRIISH